MSHHGVPSLAALAALAVVCAAVACSSGQPADIGVTEPMYLAGTQFISGDMPGSPPIDVDAGGDGGAAPSGPLSVLSVDYNNVHVVPGAAGKSFSGTVTNDSFSIGVRLADLGTGYWIVPVGAPDGQEPNASDFGFNASFDANDPPGLHNLRIVAIDGNGNGGTQVDTQLCIESRIPDNGHACDPGAMVPAAVFTLQWDANFDLDLHVITPDGTDINPKTNPLQYAIDAGTPPPADPKVDRDSLGRCVPDGLRQEDLVFPSYPAVGPYDIYADPFDSCGQPAVRFQLTIYEAGSDGELHATYSQGGELLSSQTTGGDSPGLFVTEKQFN